MSPYQVFLDGAAGTTGLRIRQRLAQRDDISLLSLPEARRKDPTARLEALREADLSILCLPDDAARDIAAAAPAGARILDASTAHRTQPGWCYGFPELDGRRDALRRAEHASVPGCHATGFLSLVAPLVEKGLLTADASLTCHSLTGYSGGGKAMIAAYEAPDRPDSYSAPRLYGLGLAHKHLPEMQSVAGLTSPPLFCPVVDDYYSGMLVTLPLLAGCLPAPLRRRDALVNFYADYYAGEPLITVRPASYATQDGTLAVNELAGRDSLEIFVLGNDTQFLLAARFDNLGKGASGAAIQCMNLMLGLEETAGLVL